LKGLHSIRDKIDNFDTQSEFSVMTNESEVRNNENILDFVV